MNSFWNSYRNDREPFAPANIHDLEKTATEIPRVPSVSKKSEKSWNSHKVTQLEGFSLSNIAEFGAKLLGWLAVAALVVVVACLFVIITEGRSLELFGLLDPSAWFSGGINHDNVKDQL